MFNIPEGEFIKICDTKDLQIQREHKTAGGFAPEKTGQIWDTSAGNEKVSDITVRPLGFLALNYNLFFFWIGGKWKKIDHEPRGLRHGRPFSTFVKGLQDYALIYVGAEEYLLPLRVLISAFDWG